MHFGQRKALAALRRIQVFLDAHSDRVAVVNAGGARSALNDVTQKLETLVDVQDQTPFVRKSEMEAEIKARTDLRDKHMRPIARIAKLELRSVQEFPQLKLPHVSVDSQTLIAWARAMATAAGKYSQTFITNGLAADFVAALVAATEPVQQALDLREAGRARRVGATEGLRQETTRAIGVIGVIDALVTRELAGDQGLTQEWKVTRTIARRAAKATQVAAGGTPEPVVPSPVTPTPVTPTPIPVVPAEPPVPVAATGEEDQPKPDAGTQDLTTTPGKKKAA